MDKKYVDMNYKNVDYKYKYPKGLNLKPGSKLHDDLVNVVMDYIKESYDVMSKRYPSWREINRVLTSYIPTDSYEDAIKNADPRKPLSMVIPKSFATLDTLLAYFMAAFGEHPIFRYSGYSADDIVGAKKLELAVGMQNIMKKTLLNLRTAWRDGFAYGIGGVSNFFTKDIVRNEFKTTKEETSKLSWRGLFSGLTLSDNVANIVKEKIVYEGNSVTNLDPFCMFPDINVNYNDIQKGSYFGWIHKTNIFDLLSDEKAGNGIFNALYVRHLPQATSRYFSSESTTGRTDRFTNPSVSYGKDAVHIVYVVAKICPDMYGLGKESYPQKWLFGIAGDSIIVRAEPLSFAHNQFPIAVCAPDTDGHSPLSMGRLEVVYPSQAAMDWFISTHVANSRKTVNNMFVVDPYILNMDDMIESKAGLLARISNRFWGEAGAVDKAIKQLPVYDVTRGNIADAAYLSDVMREAAGDAENVVGMQRKHSGRVTAAEITTSRSSALGRLASLAQVVSMQLHQDLSFQQGHNTIQFMSDDIWAEIIGDEREYAELMPQQNRVPITRSDIDINFNIVPGDGTIPGAVDVTTLQQMFQIIATQPALYPLYDLGKLFTVIAKGAGVKNISHYLKNVSATTMPDEEVVRQAEKGNLIQL